MAKKQKPKQENFRFFLAISLGFLVLATFFKVFDDSANNKTEVVLPGTQSEIDKRASQLINQNLQADQSRSELRARQVASENELIKESANLKFDPEVFTEKSYETIDPSIHDGSDAVYEDIFGESANYDVHLSPSQRIEAKLHKMKVLDQYDYQQKLAFVEAFIQNAYDDGFEVEINEDLEVVEVKKITTKEPYRGTATLDKLLDRQDY